MDPGFQLLGWTILLWCLYLVRVGGDFMEFRMMVPILPFLFVSIVWTITIVLPAPEARWMAAGLVVAGSLTHALTYGTTHEIESVRELKAHLGPEGGQWIEAGRSLGRLFDGSERVVIATSAAGAIPYYSDLATVDMLGINDRWVARSGLLWTTRPGHQRLATTEYMLERRVNLVLGHPLVDTARATPGRTGPSAEAGQLGMSLAAGGALPASASVVEIPLSTGARLLALYLVRSPSVDRAIAAHDLRTYPLPAR